MKLNTNSDARPTLDEKGLAPHGATWGKSSEVVLRAISRGPGVAVEVGHPRNGAPPRRVLSGEGSARLTGGRLMVTPTAAAAGQEFTLVVEV